MGNNNKSPKKGVNTLGIDSPKSKICLTLKCFTWEKESHGLFDYESKSIIKITHQISDPGKVLREKTEIKFIQENIAYEPNQDHNFLFEFEHKNGDYSINSKTFNPNLAETAGLGESAIWFVVKSLKLNQSNKGYKLNIGDYFKLGRMRFRIKEFKSIDNERKKFEKNDEKDINITEIEEKTNRQNPPIIASLSSHPSKLDIKSSVCRICLGDDNEADNPLLTPCKCAGTMKFIHILCLQKWLKSKLQMKQTEFYTSMIIKPLLCELCRTQFPEIIKHLEKTYESLEISKPDNHYVIIEVLSRDKNICKGMHIISMKSKNEIKMGRGHDVDIRINDISVSRFHAVLKLEKGEFFLEDNNSKFGTLVLLKEIKKLNLTSSFALQIGRTVLSLSLIKKKKERNSCFGIGSKKKKNSEKKSKTKEQNEKIKEDANQENEILEDGEIEQIDEGNELDNVIFNSDVVPNHIDIIDFDDEENMEPEIIIGNENLNNNENEHEHENQINNIIHHNPFLSIRNEESE